MKKIFFAVLVSLLVCTIGCSDVNNTFVEDEAHNSVSNVESVIEDVSEGFDAYFFATTDELEMAVVSKQYDKHSLNNLTEYYLPKNIPHNAEFDYIQVKDFYIAVYYQFDNDEAYYMLEWFRTLTEGQLQNGMLKYFSGDSISAIGKYYVVTSENISVVKNGFR